MHLKLYHKPTHKHHKLVKLKATHSWHLCRQLSLSGYSHGYSHSGVNASMGVGGGGAGGGADSMGGSFVGRSVLQGTQNQTLSPAYTNGAGPSYANSSGTPQFTYGQGGGGQGGGGTGGDRRGDSGGGSILQQQAPGSGLAGSHQSLIVSYQSDGTGVQSGEAVDVEAIARKYGLNLPTIDSPPRGQNPSTLPGHGRQVRLTRFRTL
jgi:hypothetical protein